jgi:topoisomerase-4 subunit A
MIKTKVDDKTFVGKDIIHCGVFKKGDERTIYNMIYKDGESGNTMIKRFAVKGITRNKEYTLTKTNKGSKVLYFTANPNGQAEQVTIHLRVLQRLKKLKIDVDFSKITIKGRSANGNIITKNTVKKVELKSEGISTLSARKIWFDDAVQRLNVDKRGEFLGAFEAEDKILTINQQGDLQLKGFGLSTHFDEDMVVIEKFNPAKPISAIYFDGKKERYFVKRFKVEVKSKKLNFITQHKNSFLEIASTDWRPQAKVVFVKEKGKQRKTVIINMEEFIAVKGVKAIGNKLSNNKIKEINLLEALPFEEEKLEETKQEIEIIESENISETREDNDNKQISLDL